jgi:hypothetical protein
MLLPSSAPEPPRGSLRSPHITALLRAGLFFSSAMDRMGLYAFRRLRAQEAATAEPPAAPPALDRPTAPVADPKPRRTRKSDVSAATPTEN